MSEIEDRLGDLGLRDPDQPTEAVHRAYAEAMTAEFTPAERRMIRVRLGIFPTPGTEAS